MNKSYYFPTVMSSEINLELANTMLPLAQQFLADPLLLTWTWGYKNTYTTNHGLERHQEMQPFVNYILLRAQEFLTSSGYDSARINLGIQLFVSEMNPGDKHGLHTHPNCIISGVFYLAIPEGSSSIKFRDPRPFRNTLALPILQDTLENWVWVHIDPEPGLLLMWPSWLEHEVPINQAQGRITLVFNLAWLGQGD